MSNSNKKAANSGKSLSTRKEAIAKVTNLSKDAPLPAVDDGENVVDTKAEDETENVVAEEQTEVLAPVAESKVTKSSSNVVDRSRYGYQANKEQKTAGGRASVDNNDPLAQALRGLDADAVVDLVRANGGEVNPNWEHLNQGLRRMSAGNILRKLARRSEGIKVRDTVVKLDPLPEDPAKAAAKAEKEKAREAARQAKEAASAAKMQETRKAA